MSIIGISYDTKDLIEGTCPDCGKDTLVVPKDGRCPDCIFEQIFYEHTMINDLEGAL